MSRALPALLLVGALPLAAAAADLQADVDARKVGTEDTFQLTVTVSGGDAALATRVPLPELVGLEVVGGPMQSSQVSVVNGQVSQSRAFTWVLRPTAAGQARIGGLRLEVNGQALTTDPIDVEVVDGSVRPRHPAHRGADPFGDPFADLFDSPFRQRQRREPTLAVRAIPDRERVHVGEPVLLTYWLYTDTGVTDLGLVDAPQYPGFWAEELERGNAAPQGERATLDGAEVRRFPVVRRLLFPTRAGDLAIPEARFRIGLQPQGFFSDRAVVERAVPPVTIHVLPLPEAPGFTGAVGRFRASASVDRSALPLGEAATLRFRVEGTGNLKWIEDPPALEIPGARVYPPQVSSDVKITPRGAEGSKTWEYVVVPETAGAVEIPAIPFAWFDPEAGKLQRTATAPIPLSVTGAPGVVAPAAARVADGDRGLPLRAELEIGGPRLRVPAGLLAAALALGLGLHALIWLGPQLLDARRRASGRRTPAHRVRSALGELDRAGRGDLTKEAAASAIEKALHEAFGALDGDLVDASGEGTGDEARALLERVQFIRYAPQLGDYSDELRSLAARARSLVKRA